MTAATAIRIAEADAAAIIGAPAEQIEACRRFLPDQSGRPSPGFTLADLLGLAIVRDIADRQSIDPEPYAAGLTALFRVLSEAGDVSRLDGLVAMVGPAGAELLPRHARRLNSPAGYAVVPLGPLLADLRDQVFA